MSNPIQAATIFMLNGVGAVNNNELVNPSTKVTFRRNILLTILVLVLMVAGWGWSYLVSHAPALIKAKALEQVGDIVNGTVTIENLDVSLSGTVLAQQVAVYDQSGTRIGQADQIRMDVSVDDLLSRRFDLQALKKVTLENPSIFLNQTDGTWNWEEVVKSKTDKPLLFRGQIIINHAAVDISGSAATQVEGVTGHLDFAAYPAIGVNLTGRKGTIPVSVKGSWSVSGDGEIVVQADKVPLDGVKLETLTQADMAVRDGILDTLRLNISKKAGAYTIAGEGIVSGFEGTAAGFDISQGSGTFTFNDAKAVLTNTSFRYKGQLISAEGNVALGNNMEVDCYVTAAGFDPSVLAGPSLQGIVSFQAKVQGSVLQPQASGRFSIPEGAFSTLRFSAAEGAFTYAGGTLTLHDTYAAIWGGSAMLNGTVWPSGPSFDIAVSGRGIDSTLLTDKDISGPVNFQAAVAGQGTTSVAASGTFQMGEGKFYGVPFLSMEGEFTKQGEQTNFTNVTVYTAGGSFSATGFTEGSVVRLQKREFKLEDPVERIKENVHKALADKLKILFP